MTLGRLPRRVRVLLLGILILALAVPLPGCTGESGGDPGGDSIGASALVTRVVDGDTIVIEGGDRVRYIGMDAPEMPDEPLALEATEENARLVEGKPDTGQQDLLDRMEDEARENGLGVWASSR